MFPRRLTPLAASRLVKRTRTVQVCPGVSVVPVQVFALVPLGSITRDHVNSPDPAEAAATATFVTVTDAPPVGWVLVRVTTPVPVTEKAGSVIVSGFGVIETVPVPPPPPPVPPANSTAPASTALFALRETMPKKSLGGAAAYVEAEDGM